MQRKDSNARCMVQMHQPIWYARDTTIISYTINTFHTLL